MPCSMPGEESDNATRLLAWRTKNNFMYFNANACCERDNCKIVSCISASRCVHKFRPSMGCGWACRRGQATQKVSRHCPYLHGARATFHRCCCGCCALDMSLRVCLSHRHTHTHTHTLTDWIAHVASPRINQQFVRCSVRFDHIFGLRYAGGHITFRSHNHNNNNNNKKPMYAFRHCVQVGERNTITLYARLHDDNTHTHSYAGGQNVRTFMRCHDPCELVCANSCTCVVVLG